METDSGLKKYMEKKKNLWIVHAAIALIKQVSGATECQLIAPVMTVTYTVCMYVFPSCVYWVHGWHFATAAMNGTVSSPNGGLTKKSFSDSNFFSI